jgi:hypothetical protein
MCRRARARSAALVLSSLCALTLAACGGAATTASRAPSPRADSLSTEPTPTPTQLHGEQASNLHLSPADCAALASRLAALTGAEPRRRSEPTPPLSRCVMTGPGLDLNVYLDTGHAARQRYENRISEQVQFGAPDPTKLPHPVPGVGEPGAYDHYASWVPAYHTLYAVRGNRWLTVAYSRAGVPSARLRAEAAALARLAFRLSAG